LTAQVHPRRIFATAIDRGNIGMAEATARELGRISLEEALALTALVDDGGVLSLSPRRAVARGGPRDARGHGRSRH
jgi:hypothetical protein